MAVTIEDFMKNNENVMVRISAVPSIDEIDEAGTVYEGMLAEIPVKYRDIKVVKEGWLIGAQLNRLTVLQEDLVRATEVLQKKAILESNSVFRRNYGISDGSKEAIEQAYGRLEKDYPKFDLCQKLGGAWDSLQDSTKQLLSWFGDYALWEPALDVTHVMLMEAYLKERRKISVPVSELVRPLDLEQRDRMERVMLQVIIERDLPELSEERQDALAETIWDAWMENEALHLHYATETIVEGIRDGELRVDEVLQMDAKEVWELQEQRVSQMIHLNAPQDDLEDDLSMG